MTKLNFQQLLLQSSVYAYYEIIIIIIKHCFHDCLMNRTFKNKAFI